MFIFAILNFICLSIILAKFIWYSENSRIETNNIVMKMLGIPKSELDIIREDQDAEELNHTCDHCNECCDTDDDNSHDSMPELVEAGNKVSEEDVETKLEETDKEIQKNVEDKSQSESESDKSDDVSIEHVSAQDLEVIKETIGFIQKTKEMLFEIKNDLEKKID